MVSNHSLILLKNPNSLDFTEDIGFISLQSVDDREREMKHLDKYQKNYLSKKEYSEQYDKLLKLEYTFYINALASNSYGSVGEITYVIELDKDFNILDSHIIDK